MYSYANISSKAAAFENIRQSFAKDIASITVVDKSYCTEIRIEVITCQDVFSPITETCFYNIYTNGTMQINDPFVNVLKGSDKIYRDNLLITFIKKIKDALVE